MNSALKVGFVAGKYREGVNTTQGTRLGQLQ